MTDMDTRTCHACGRAMSRGTRAVEFTYKGRKITLNQPGYYCAACSEGAHTGVDMAATEAAFMAFKKRDYLPIELVDRMIAGEHPVRIWREHRGLTLAALSARSGVGFSYIAKIEHGKKPDSTSALKNLAEALGVETDDLIRGH